MSAAVCAVGVLLVLLGFWLNAPRYHIQFENHTGEPLHDVVIQLSAVEVALGEVSENSRVSVPADDIGSIRYRLTRADGSQHDAETGFGGQDDGLEISTVYIRIKPTNSGTGYDWKWSPKLFRLKWRQWFGWP